MLRPSLNNQVTISKQEHIEFRQRANYLEAQPSRAQSKIKEFKQQVVLKDAKIKALQNRLFGKKSEKGATAKSEKGNGALNRNVNAANSWAAVGMGVSSAPISWLSRIRSTWPRMTKNAPRADYRIFAIRGWINKAM